MLRTALRGTTRFNSADIGRRLENAGAQIQVVNDPDFFGYVISGLSGKMNQALGVLIDVLQQPRFDPADLERERTLQLSRIRKLREDNYAYPVRLFLQTLFGEHPYSRPGIGTADSVTNLTGDDLRHWFESNERKTKPLIVIAGDSNGTSLIAPLTERLTNVDLVERDISRLPLANPPRVKGDTVQSIARQQTAMVYGFSGPMLNNADRSTLTVFQNVVSGLGGRFFDAIRDKQGLAYTVSTSNAFFTRGGAVYIYSAFSPENEAAVRTALETEIESIRKNGVMPEEVRKAVAFSIGDHEAEMQSRDATVLEYARAIYSGAGVASVAKYSDAISKVTPEQVQAAVQKYFDPAGLRVAIVRGEKKN
jgi:zinc protease